MSVLSYCEWCGNEAWEIYMCPRKGITTLMYVEKHGGDDHPRDYILCCLACSKKDFCGCVKMLGKEEGERFYLKQMQDAYVEMTNDRDVQINDTMDGDTTFISSKKGVISMNVFYSKVGQSTVQTVELESGATVADFFEEVCLRSGEFTVLVNKADANMETVLTDQDFITLGKKAEGA